MKVKFLYCLQVLKTFDADIFNRHTALIPFKGDHISIQADKSLTGERESFWVDEVHYNYITNEIIITLL